MTGPRNVITWQWGRRLCRGLPVAVALIVVWGASPAAAQSFTGNEWRTACKADATPCVFYLRGFVEGTQSEPKRVGGYTRHTYRLLDIEWCQPDGVTYGQLRAVVNAWLSAHPEMWHVMLTGLISKALNENFPCSESPKGETQ